MIKQFRIAFGLKMGSSILTFRARQVANAPETSLEARWRDWPLTFFDKLFQKISKKYPKMSKYLLKIDLGGVRMDPYGPGWVRMVPKDSLGASWGVLGPWGAQKGG